MAELKGNKYGTHRVIEPKGVLTQAAWRKCSAYLPPPLLLPAPLPLPLPWKKRRPSLTWS